MSARISAEEFYHKCIGTPLDMVLIRRIFLLLTRIHWSDGQNHYQDDVDFTCLTYSDAEENSQLAVELTDIYDDNDTDNFPGIFVGFKNGYNLSKKILNYDSSKSDDNSVQRKLVAWEGALTLSHIHKSADTAMAMADSTFVFMMAARETLMNNFDIQEMDFLQIGAPSKLDPEKSNRFFKVDLIIRLRFTVTVNVSLESHRIKTFGIELSPS